ncbi:MAG: biofilm regulation diguanylate cyclase SiaD [Cyanobium sp.]
MTSIGDLRSSDALDERIAELLADDQFVGHPLRDALAEMVDRMTQQVSRLERITQISDRYQSGAQERVRTLSRRYDRQIRTLERAISISDRYQAMLNDLNKALREASTHDLLTCIPNRRLMSERCRMEDERLAREDGTYSLLTMDVDRFKQFNDIYGHDVGDQVLVELANSFTHSLREYDSCGRWGGEEFLALLVNADLATAADIAERMLENTRALRMPVGEQILQATISIGVAERAPGELYTHTYKRADDALLLAKQSGRDRYIVANAPDQA